MRKSVQLYLLLFFGVFTAGIAAAQSSSTPPAASLKYYKADFFVKEVDASGHIVNSRSYSTILLTDNNGGVPKQIRSGDKIPISTGTDDKDNTKFQYIDIGVNIDCRFVHEVDQKLAASVTAEVSSVPGSTKIDSTVEPLIRQFKWNADVLIAPGVPTTIFSSDDVGSKSKIQVEMTATPIR
jgi:hypothetical protein